MISMPGDYAPAQPATAAVAAAAPTPLAGPSQAYLPSPPSASRPDTPSVATASGRAGLAEKQADKEASSGKEKGPETEEEKDKKYKKDQNVDRITVLPNELIHKIFDHCTRLSQFYLSQTDAVFCEIYWKQRPSPFRSSITPSTPVPEGLIFTACKTFFFDSSRLGPPRDEKGKLLFCPEVEWPPPERREEHSATKKGFETDRAE